MSLLNTDDAKETLESITEFKQEILRDLQIDHTRCLTKERHIYLRGYHTGRIQLLDQIANEIKAIST